MEPRQRRTLGQILYNHNPFYLISACCALFVIKRVFRPSEVLYIDPWMLMAALSGLTILMATTAWVIVRFGRVWEDARSLMLVLVIMFLAMSVSFDELLNINGDSALWLLGVGFALSVLITETIVRLLKIPLPWLFRGPFYVMLALFFGYPILVSPEVSNITPGMARWRIAAFPLVAGLCSLTLLPAVWRGRKLIDNGDSPCPWKWPLLPWTLFGFLGLAVCARSYYLSISFDPSWGWDWEMFTSFGAYLLNPFLLCACFIILEIALVEKMPRLQNGVLVVGSTVLVLCSFPYPGNDPTYIGFLLELMREVGSPAFVTLFGVLLFGGYGWLRGIRSGEFVVLAALAGLSVVGERTLGIRSLTEPHVVPVGAIFGLTLITGLARRDPLRCFFGIAAVCGALALVMQNSEYIYLRRTLPIHILLISIIGIGAWMEGKFASFLHSSGAILVPVVTALTTRSLLRLDAPLQFVMLYFVVMTVAAIVYGKLSKSRPYYLLGLSGLAAGVIRLIIFATAWLHQLFGVEVVATIAAGLVCFAIGTRISVLKAKQNRQSGNP